jgi:hypothetical protein
MNDLRIRVAKYAGWRDIGMGPVLGSTDKSIKLIGVPSWYKGKNPEYNKDEIPHYDTDLNEIHYVVCRLDPDKLAAFEQRLIDKLGMVKAMHATAKERAEAYVWVMEAL